MPEGNGYPNNRDVDYFKREIAELKRRLKALETGRRAAATSVDTGDFTIRKGALRLINAEGQTIMFIGAFEKFYGQLDGFDWDQSAIRIQRANGNAVLEMRQVGNLSDMQYWGMYDNSGNIIVSDDAVSAQGLARPYIPYQMQQYTDFTTGPTTTSATMVPLWTAHGMKQHPKTITCVYVTTAADTVGEIDLYDFFTDTVIAGPINIPIGSNKYEFLIGSVGADWSGMTRLDVRARRVSGTGTVRVGLAYCYGTQT